MGFFWGGGGPTAPLKNCSSPCFFFYLFFFPSSVLVLLLVLKQSGKENVGKGGTQGFNNTFLAEVLKRDFFQILLVAHPLVVFKNQFIWGTPPKKTKTHKTQKKKKKGGGPFSG